MGVKRILDSHLIVVLKSFLFKHYEWVLVILSPIILFGPMLISGKVLFWGTPSLQFVPWHEFAIDSLLQGHLPLWNPWLGMGAPLIANYQSAIFYPPNWILLLTGPAWGQGFLVLLHILWTGIGMLLLVKHLGMSKLSQTIAALSFSLSGYVIGRAGFLSINATLAWFPWIILFADGLLLEQNSPGKIKRLIKPTILLSLVFCLQWLSGHAQTAWYCLIFAVAWVSWRGYSLRRGTGFLQGLMVLGVAAIVAFLLSTIQLLPTAEYLLNSHRATEVERGLAMVYSFWPWRILGLVMPNLFGSPVTGDYWGYANYWEDATYIGVLPIILSLLAAVRGFKGTKFSAMVRFLLCSVFVSFILALGKNLPVFTFLYDHIPTFDLFQAPSRWTVIMIFCLCLLAAIGAELWQQKELVRLFWVRLGTVGAAAAGVIALVGERILSNLRESFAPAIVFASLWLTITGVIAWRRRIRPANYWPLLITSFIAVDLIWASNGLNPSISMDFFKGKSELVEQVSAEHRVYMPADVEGIIKFDWTHRFDSFFPEVEWHLVRDTGLPNTTMLDGIPSVNNFDPILPDRFVKWMNIVNTATGSRLIHLLELMDVGWEAELGNVKDFQIFYSALQEPNRMYLVGKAIWVKSGEDVLDRIQDQNFDHEEYVLLEGDPTLTGETDPQDSKFTILEQSDPNKLRVKVLATDEAWFVLSDTWFPGWQAKVDGELVDMYRANYLFRAVHLPKGEHIVEFYYHPVSFILGGIITFLACIFVGVFWWIQKQK